MDEQVRPTEAQFAAAIVRAQEINELALRRASRSHLGQTGCWRGEFAVYAHAADAWVCPYCNGTTYMGMDENTPIERMRMPMGPASCVECGKILER